MSGLSSIYIMTSRMQGQRKKMDSVAVNVANANTPGFKRQGVDFETIVGGRDSRPAGNFVKDRGFKTTFSQGPINATGNPFDAAIMGDGFFAVGGLNGVPNYTRDGHFTMSPDGTLTNWEGQPVLDDTGNEIAVPPNTRFEITPDGTITSDGQAIARLGVFQFDELATLTRVGGNQFQYDGPAPQMAQNVQVISGAIESSNVDPVLETVRMTEVSQAYQGAANLVSRMEDLQSRAIRELPSSSQ
ncbi:MAG: flagellar basal-body rod protein FlgF [Magnetococcales bacterium]|nr:flagellar basal-body rod protein FlgF [Magnetococcales bacterium]